LEFCSPVWNPWMEMDKECLEKVQKRAVSLISGLKSKDYSERLQELGMASLEERRKQLDMIQSYKIMTGLSRVESRTWFERAVDGERTTRLAADPLNIRPKTARLDIRRNFYTHRVGDNWNNIPSTVKSSVTVNGFKINYNNYLRGLLVPT